MSFNDVTATDSRSIDGGTATLLTEPEPPEAGPDRLGVNILLEALLALAFAGALFWLYRGESPLATAEGRDGVIVMVVPLLLLSIATALSLRAGAVNLAVGAIGVAGAVMFAENAGRGLAVALLAAVGLALACGLVLTVLVVLLRTPAWLASGAMATVTLLWVFQYVNIASLSVEPLALLPASSAWIWLISVAALSIFGGVVGALNGWRHRLGSCREANSGTGPTDGVTRLVTGGVLLGSSVLAALAGVWIVWTATDGAAVVAGLNPAVVTVFPLAAALLGGTSALGRRGGILGTLLAGLLLATLLLLARTNDWPVIPLWIMLAAVGAGLVITHLVEILGRPREIAPPVPEPVSPPEVEPLPAQPVAADPYPYDGGDIDPYRRHDMDAQR